MRRAQAGMEYVAAFVIVLLVFLAVQLTALNNRNDALDDRTAAKGNSLAREVANALVIAYASPGSSQLFLIPASLEGSPYFVRVSNETVAVEWEENGRKSSATAGVRLPTVRNASGATSFNITSGGHYSANNSNGVVRVVKLF